MAAKKLLRLVSGRITEILGIVTSAGGANDGDFPVLDATGRLDTSVLPVGIGADTKSIISSETLAAGDFVNVFDNAAVLNVRKADATAVGKEAVGFVLAGVTAPAAALVFFEGSNTQLTALTLGVRHYLSTTPGAATTTPPATAGNVVQFLGLSTAATEIAFEASEGIVVA